MVLGISFAKDMLFYAYLEGTKEQPQLIEKGKIDTLSTSDVPKMMDWFHTKFLDLIISRTPCAIAARQNLDLKKDQQIYFLLPLGVLSLAAFAKHVPLTLWSSAQYRPNRFGLSKDVDIYELCDNKFGINPPYWNNPLKNAILAAWFSLT